jgi:hypothetical protein
MQHDGVLYLTLSRYFGDTDASVIPAIYWAFVQLGTPDLCVLTRTASGVLTSNQAGLGLTYPVIAARPGGGARLVYTFAGANALPNSLGKPFGGGSQAHNFLVAAHNSCLQDNSSTTSISCNWLRGVYIVHHRTTR